MSVKKRRGKRIRKQTRTRRILRAVVKTTGILLIAAALLFAAALLTVDIWILPFVCWCTGLEVEGDPGVDVSLFDRAVVLTGLKVNIPAGRIETKSCKLKLDDWTLVGWDLHELRVSQVRVDGLRATLDFAKYAEWAGMEENDPISGETMRTLSHKAWNRASKTLVRIADLTLTDAEVCWQSGVSRSVISVPSLTAEFEDGLLTRPRLTCGLGVRLNQPQRDIQFGLRVRAVATEGTDSVIVSAAGNGPLKVDLPDAHLEFPPSESLDMVVQYEPDSDLIRFGGEWGKSDRWENRTFDLSMDNALFEMFGTLALDGEMLRLRFGTSAQGSDLVCRGNRLPGDMKFVSECNVNFDLATGAVKLDSLSGHLTGPNGGRVDLETSGVFEFVRNEDATYTLMPHAARLMLTTGKPLDLAPFDPVLPFEGNGRELTAEYFIDLDPEKIRLNGGAKAEIRERETGTRIFDADAVFEADGVTRIRSFHVSRCGVAFYDGDERICKAAFTGEYDIRTASLKGEANYYPYRMIDTFGNQGLASLCAFLDDANLCDAEHTATATLDLDLVNMAATFHKESHLSHLALTGSNGKNLELDAVGDASFSLAQDGSGWRMECGMELNAGPDFRSVMRASGRSDMPIEGRIDVEHISDILAHQLGRKFSPGETGDLPFLLFLNASASADFRYDPAKNRIELTGITANVDNGDGRLDARCESKLVWEDGAFLRAPAVFSVKTASLPVSFLDPLLGECGRFQLAGGVLSSEFDFTVSADGTIVSGTGKLVGTDMAYLLDGNPYALARVGANGSFVYNHGTSFLIVPELNLDVQDRKARQTLFASGSGTVDVADGCRLRMLFPEVRVGPEALSLIGHGVERCFYFEDLDAAGEIEFNAKHLFSEMSWSGGLKINRMRLQSDDPETYRFAELSGRIDGMLLWADKDLYGDASIRLSDETGEEHFSGQYLYRRGEDARPKFVSSSLDLPFSVSYFRYNHNTDPEMDTSDDFLIDKTFDLDLHGVYARKHSLIFSVSGPLILRDGEDPAILAPHLEFSGDVFGSASAEIHVTEKTWPFEITANLNNIPLDKSFTAFLATDDSPEIPHNLHGFINRLDAGVRGEGFTTDALTRNLSADCKAELERVSLRSYLRDRSPFLNILLLPLLSVPRLIDYIPGEMIRRALRLATAGAIMDMISGEAPIEFTRGTMDMSVRQGIMELRKLSLEGDPLDEYTVSGTIDLAGDGNAELETNTQFAFFYWPIYLTGNILDPQVSYGRSISHFFTDNTKHLLFLFPNMIISTFSQNDADEIDRLEREASEKAKSQDPETPEEK